MQTAIQTPTLKTTPATVYANIMLILGILVIGSLTTTTTISLSTASETWCRQKTATHSQTTGARMGTALVPQTTTQEIDIASFGKRLMRLSLLECLILLYQRESLRETWLKRRLGTNMQNKRLLSLSLRTLTSNQKILWKRVNIWSARKCKRWSQRTQRNYSQLSVS